MSEKTKQMLFKGLKQILKATLFFVILIFYYSSCFISWLFENCAILVEKMLIKLGVFEHDYVQVVNNNSFGFDPLFNENEIKTMANSLPDHVNTINEIQHYLSVSYRQARKIKSALDDIKSAPDIQRITA